MGLDQSNCAHRLGCRQFSHFLNPLPAIHLHPDLNHASRATECVSHAPGVAGVERHRFFLVYVLAGLDRRDEVKRVQVLQRRDQDRVDRLVVEERSVVFESCDTRNDRFNFIETASVYVGNGDGFDIRALDSGPQDLLPARSAADQTESDALVRASDSG